MNIQNSKSLIDRIKIKVCGTFNRFLVKKLILFRSKNGYVAIDINSDYLGLGARIVYVIQILQYYEKKGYIPLFQFNYKESVLPETEYFKALFLYKNLPKPLPANIKFTSINYIGDIRTREDKSLTINVAKHLFDRYLDFNSQILDDVNAFTDRYFVGKNVLGVHYRGSDKIAEAPAVSFEDLRDQINVLLNKDTSINLIFLSTDTSGLLEYLRESTLRIPIVYREDALPQSTDSNPIHRNRNYSKALINQDAIVNCLILSKCYFLLKTASFFSDCSVIFNPKLPVAVMNVPYERMTW